MIYLDHNASTPICAEARAAMLPWLEDLSANPSSIHGPGRRAQLMMPVTGSPYCWEQNLMRLSLPLEVLKVVTLRSKDWRAAIAH